MTELIRVRAHIDGIVQGVGFRPFVHTLATGLGLAGQVRNDEAGVYVEVEGAPATVDEFLARVRCEHPPLALIEQVTVTTLLPTGAHGFRITSSLAAGRPGAPATRVLVPPDVATCPACLRELTDPADRRHRHPFVNCTDCGPRFSIVTDLPYDRPHTTMAGFEMCGDCRREYGDPADRRFHAQPIACHRCGPVLRLTGPDGDPLPGDPVATAAALLRAGQVVAVKGIGGYHLAADATSQAAVAGLRAGKHRPAKPFAVMVADLAAAAALCRLTPADERLLSGPQRPVVLLPRRPEAALAAAIAPGSGRLGVMLPYTPLHHLLLAATDRPLVMTSGNAAGEPIAHRQEEAVSRLGPLVGAIVTHNRPIHTRIDDSVATTFRGRPLLLRRARGYVPQPLLLPRPAGQAVLACGAELKNTFCLAAGARAFLSPHIGDLTNYETYQSYRDQIGRLRRLLGVVPAVTAHDLHPDYLSTQYALAIAAAEGLELVAVQHHHAHVASCLVDNATDGPVIGVAFDGLGYGPDGTLWGGELLVADLAGYQRAGHLVPVPVPGGDAAVRQPWRMAVSYLEAAQAPADPHLPVRRRHAATWQQVRELAVRGGRLAPLSSSAGRLCDAVAALLGIRDEVSYEGQAAIELEQRAAADHTDAYPVSVTADAGAPVRVHGSDLVAAVVTDLQRQIPVPVIAARFHNGLAEAVVAACRQIRQRSGLSRVALTGGVYQNLLLLSRTADGLAAAGFEVLTHSRVPPNDGGIALGQAAIAAARSSQRGLAPTDPGRSDTTVHPQSVLHSTGEGGSDGW